MAALSHMLNFGFYIFCLSRPEPPSPGQTNGITTPEQLTGRFQVGVVGLDYWTLWLLITASLIWIRSCFSCTGCDPSFLLMHPSHICLSHIGCFHRPQDGSNTRHCYDLVLVPEFYGDHESQSTTYTTWWYWRQNTYSCFRMQRFLLCADILTGVIFMFLN